MKAIRYISADTTLLYKTKTENTSYIELLWGDRVVLEEPLGTKKRVKVKTRSLTGYVNSEVLRKDPLLEIYFIDVGQGDGVLIVTPERKHILIDGGYIRSKQQTKRNAADFVDWKFFKDYCTDTITLDAMINSHNDEDHYGGLWDLVNDEEKAELDTKKLDVKNFYYAGINWFEKNGKRGLGPSENGYWTLIPGSKTEIKKYLTNNPSGYVLQGQWKQFIEALLNKSPNFTRLSQNNGYLPDFGPAQSKASIKVLAPIEEKLNGSPVLRRFTGPDAQNTNGHSVLLRIDYGKSRILLTGDLNAQSQKHILNYYKNSNSLNELECDVIKSCHHGSDDCSYEFLSAVRAAATIISSGDNENHNHPRPKIVSASALTGYKQISNDRVVTPLVYSTEIARSYKLSEPHNLTLTVKDKKTDYTKKTNAVISLGPANNKKTRNLWKSLCVYGIIYGLVNVRTDGNKILCATLNENKSKWEIETFNSRF